MPPTDIRKLEGRRVFSDVIESPVGPLTLLAVDEGLAGLLFEATALTGRPVLERSDRSAGHPVLREAARQLDDYFKGRCRAFRLPLSLVGTDFQLAVWRELMKVEYGSTISYGALAASLGDGRKARAVGGAVGRNPVGIIVPCHRVVGAGGSLTGFGGGLEVKETLLALERGARESRRPR